MNRYFIYFSCINAIGEAFGNGCFDFDFKIDSNYNLGKAEDCIAKSNNVRRVIISNFIEVI